LPGDEHVDGLGSANILQFEEFRFDRAGGCLTRLDGPGVAGPVALGSRALGVLALLVSRQGQLVTKDEIMAAVWPGTAVEEGNLTVQISALRRVLDQSRAQGSCIQTVSGRGYRFVAPITRGDAGAAAPISSLGNGSGTPIAVDGQPEWRSADFRTNALSPTPAQRKSHLLRRALVAGVAGAFCLATAVVAAVDWRSLSPWKDSPAPRLSIVVLPFTNLSNDPDQQYFADGITDDLTTDLSRLSDMFVIARNTGFTYKEKPLDLRQIGRELGVRYVLEGSVRRSGNQVRVNAQLIDAATDAHLWAERFDRDTGDLFALQSGITRRIAIALDAELVSAEAARPNEHPDALDYLLRGRAAGLNPHSADVDANSLSMFERALTVDPGSAEAKIRLALALAYRVLGNRSTSCRSDIMRAEALIDQALAASPRSQLAHWAKAQLLRAQHRCAEAIPEFEMIIASDRNSAGAYAALGHCKFSEGAIDETIPLEEKAIQLSPRDPAIGIWYWRIGVVHLLQSRTDEAVRWLEKGCAATPGIPLHHAWLAAALALDGEYERAATELAEARRQGGEGSYSSIARLRTLGVYGASAPKIQTLFEATYFAGLRKAGMPEE